MAAEKIYHRNEEIIDSEIDDEVVMMDVEKGAYYGMNNIGSTIWKLLDRPKNMEEIIDELVIKFDVTKKQCKTDIQPFVEQLVKTNVLIEKKQ